MGTESADMTLKSGPETYSTDIKLTTVIKPVNSAWHRKTKLQKTPLGRTNVSNNAVLIADKMESMTPIQVHTIIGSSVFIIWVPKIT